VPVLAALCLVATIHFVRLYAWAALYALGRPLDAMPGQLVEAAVVLAWPLAVGGGAGAGGGGGATAVVAAAWVMRAALAAPVDAWMLGRAGGWRPGPLLARLAPLALAAAAMAGAVVALGAPLSAAGVPAAPRLLLLVATGAGLYAALLALVRRDLARRLAAFVGAAARRGRHG
jgi:hypothetical protein